MGANHHKNLFLAISKGWRALCKEENGVVVVGPLQSLCKLPGLFWSLNLRLLD
jgi:hypothetical protein